MEKRCNGCFNYYDDEFELCPHCGYIDGSEPREPNHLFIGTELAGRYIIGNVLGFGGFGITYKAWDKKLEAVVAIKEYYPSGIVNRPPGTKNILLFSGKKKKEFEYGLTRFIEEARNMTNFNSHRNIVNVYEYFEENSTAYIVMEFLDGYNLSEYIESVNGKLDIETSMKIIMNTCNALKDIHANGIIHRDVSPDNIFLTKNGGIKLIDFGAARFSNNEDKNFTIILKPGFAPPEQYDQISQQGPKTDIYALGATMYYCITGEKPEESTNRKIKDNLLPPKQIDTSIEQYISDSIMKAMAIESSLRFESIAEFEKAIKKEIKVKVPSQEKKSKQVKRLIGIAIFVALFSVVAGVFLSDIDKKQEQVTLDPATINIYYIDDDNSEEMAAAYSEIVSSFCEEYPDVTVVATKYTSDEYEAVIEDIKQGESEANLFISDGMSEEELSSMLDLSSVIYSVDDGSSLNKFFNKFGGNATECSVFDKYDKYYPNHKQVPIGFNIPVIYINTNYLSVEDESIKNFDEIESYLAGENKILVDSSMSYEFETIFDTESNIIQEGNIEQFIDGSVSMCFSSTANYLKIKDMTKKGVGVPVMLAIEGKLPCEFSIHWSILPSEDEAENRAATTFLAYMLTQNAQNKLLGENKSTGALPINDYSLDTYATVFDEFEYLVSKKGNFKF